MPVSGQIHLLLIDDHPVFRRGLAAMLNQQDDMIVVGEADTGREGIDKAVALRPNVTIMDISMPDLNGVDATAKIISQIPDARILGLSMYSERRFVTQMLRAGATGYVPKSATPGDVFRGIRAVAEGKMYLSPDVTCHVIDAMTSGEIELDEPYEPLSQREREVLQLIAEGNTTKQTAARLNVSPKTIESHRKNIMTKLNLYSIAELTRYAIREGISPLDV